MKNPHKPQPDPISGTIEHDGVKKPMKPMNDNMATAKDGSVSLQNNSQNSNKDLTEGLTQTNSIDPDSLTNEVASDGQDNFDEGLTPMHRQNIDESRVDEVLVDDTQDDKHYPNINDIADDNAVQHSLEDE